MQDELEEFCRREHPQLVRSLHLVCGSRPVAEDLAQETLARVCKDWGRIRHLESPGAYAHRTAMNLATSRFRRRAVRRRVDAELSYEWQQLAHGSDAATGVVVREALQALRVEHRKVLVLRYFLGYSVSETAELLRMPEGTVKTHTSRGLAALRVRLGTSLTVDGEVVPSG